MMMLESPSTSHFAETLKLLSNDNVKNESADIREFQKRIKTFILDQKWVGKPFALSPPACARYGWKCCGASKLQCVSCSATLCTSLPEMEKCASYDKCVSEILNSLKLAHRKHCPWPLAPCPDNFFRMVPVQKETAFEDFIFRLESLLLIQTFLPEVKGTVMEALALSDEHLKALCELSHVSVNPFTKSSILLATTGWQRVPDAGKKKYITCADCQRTVGVWFYSSVQSKFREEITPKEELLTSELHDTSQLVDCSGSECNDRNTDVSIAVQNLKQVVVCKQECIDTSESLDNMNGERLNSCDDSFVPDGQIPTKRRKLCLETDEPFDSLYEHRPWCMWICKTSTTDNDSNLHPPGHNSLSVPGYEVYIKGLLKNIGNSSASPCSLSSPTKEQLSQARELLMSWSSPV